MTSIIYVGMDVHIASYTLSCYTAHDNRSFATMEVAPDYKRIVQYLNQVKSDYEGRCRFVCGYEAGCLGYTLYHQLTHAGFECIILAPSTMPETPRKQVKTDKRDAMKIARCLAHHTYSPVYIPTEEDNSVKEYIRMRNDEKSTLKRRKQQLLSFCTRNGRIYDQGSYWTQKHIVWLRSLRFSNPVLNEAFQEYLILYFQSSQKIASFDARIEQFAQAEAYIDCVSRLSCLIGVKTHTALSVIVEIGDFKRFPSASHFAAYLGLVPGENSSGATIRRTGITKAGNTHLRTLLVESAQGYTRGQVGFKSKALYARQKGNSPQVIAYADKANERLRRKYYRIHHHASYNIAKTAVARELACFIWGLMTDHIA